MAPPTLPFGMPVNGFHPQMTAMPNPVGPMAIPPLPSSSRRRKAGSSTSSSSSFAQQPTRQFSLSGLIDSRTSTLVNQLRDDVRSEERHRRKMVKRRRAGYGSDSASSSSSSSFYESDASSRSASSRLVSSSEASTATARRDKRQRTSYYKEFPRSGYSVTKKSEMKKFGVAVAPPPFTTIPNTDAAPAVDTPLKSFRSTAPTTVEPCYDSTSPLSSSGSDTDQASSKASSTSGLAEDVYADGGGFSDLYSEVFVESERPQLIATLGGRIVTWNDEFLSSTGLLVSQLRGCVTVHNLVEPAMHSRLNDLFELALREGNRDGGDAGESKLGGGGSDGAVVDPARPPLMVIAPAADGRRRGLTGRRELRQVSAPMPGRVDFANVAPAVVAPATPDGGRSGSSPERGNSGAPKSTTTEGQGFSVVEGGSDVAAVASAGKGASNSDGSSEEEDEDGETHLSITLPCRRFRFATEQLCITIILMNDIDPSKRCFYCILTPPPTPPPTISFPAPSMLPMAPESHAANGDYKSIGNGWYRSLNTGAAAGFERLPFANTFAMSAQLQATLTPAIQGKIRRIGQKQLASLL